MSVRVFPEEVSIWIGELSKAPGPPQCTWGSSHPLRVWMEQNGRGRLKFLVWQFDLGHWFSHALGALGSQAFILGLACILSALWLAGPRTILLCFPGSPACWQLSFLNCMIQNLIINLFHLYIKYWFCFSGRPEYKHPKLSVGTPKGLYLRS